MSDPARHWFRFSLLNLIFLITFVAMALALWELYSELRPLHEEVLKLRGEAGYLTIDDSNRDQVHAIQVDTASPLFWKWKVYLPDDHDYWLGAIVGELPPRGEVPNKHGPVASPAQHRGSSEQIVKIAVIRNADGELVLRQQMGGISTQTPLSAEQEEILARGSWGNGRGPSAGFGGTSHSNLDEPLALLHRQMVDQNNPAGTNGKAQGIMVWIEPIVYSKHK